nr:MAG TPA: hypothetical protein [Caudoviricetes sp.]
MPGWSHDTEFSMTFGTNPDCIVFKLHSLLSSTYLIFAIFNTSCL